MDLVRTALKEGIDSPKAIVEYMTSKGVAMNPNQVSNYKSLIKKEKKTRGKRGPKPGNGRRGPRAKAASANGTGYADKVVQLKQLVQQLGADEVKKLADVLS
jgi:hypothetical protein